MRVLRLFKKDLAREVSDWIGDGLIERAQGEAILARYGASLNEGKGGSFAYYVLSALAVMFAGLAMILVLSHNWDEIPRAVRMLGLIGATLVINLIGGLEMLQGKQRAGVLWLFFGGISYGASIMLIAQIYHLGEHFPDGIFWWALGILPLVFLTRSRLIALQVLVLASLWMYTEASTGFMPYSYPIFALPCLWLVWTHRRSALIFLGSLVGLVAWTNLMLAWGAGRFYIYDPFADQVPLTVALGLAMIGGAWWLMRHEEPLKRDYGQLLHLYLLRGAILTLLILSFTEFWRDLMRNDYLIGVFNPLLLALGTLIGFTLARPSGANASGPILLNGAFFTLAALLVQQNWADPMFLAVATNLVLVITGIWLIRRGVEDAVTHFFYTGVAVLLLTAMLRYFDLIGDYIGGALLFMVAAAVLFGAARFWRNRTTEGQDHV
ncbi:DUF2157 domain-containing protein [Marinobacterium lutimaris]|uniref:Uncharacterized membrane protein n=1 Tax=Marinobacterium lutimaris TaxID=568106 RepID=A0A1H6C8X0_9GAMM|nr:DUF2157 domain-containing protein [Marinobacterium lutimaris]SEG69343.1 Uncharacterized membrane protein [Marinobacterium lutimaris]